MNILNRLRKIEASMRTTSACAVLLRQPPANASDDTHAAFRIEVIEAINAGQKVIVRCNGEDRIRLSGVDYFDDDFSALCALLALTPSDSAKNVLEEAIAKAQGSTLPVFREVGNDD